MAIGIQTNVMTPAPYDGHRPRRATKETEKFASPNLEHVVKEQTAKSEKAPIKVTVPQVPVPTLPSNSKLSETRVPIEKHPILLPTPTEAVATQSRTGSLVDLRA